MSVNSSATMPVSKHSRKHTTSRPTTPSSWVRKYLPTIISAASLTLGAAPSARCVDSDEISALDGDDSVHCTALVSAAASGNADLVQLDPWVDPKMEQQQQLRLHVVRPFSRSFKEQIAKRVKMEAPKRRRLTSEQLLNRHVDGLSAQASRAKPILLDRITGFSFFDFALEIALLSAVKKGDADMARWLFK
ncbi:hypothetical protein DFJ73DRAFT_929173 [Zopfochytrium polystomum]|nr:hypothetical protein DFJ73DRAFT_929173 [Zopfochytrium polystomum]